MGSVCELSLKVRTSSGSIPLSRRTVKMITFVRQSLQRFRQTGAIAPSSRRLARALTRPLSERGERPLEILEAGPGTGAVTVAIVRHLRPGDHLTLCEVNPGFVAHLRHRFREDPRLRPWHSQVTVHQCPVEELGAEAQFDHIICSLPFNNFAPAHVQSIFRSFERALRPSGILSFFEYAAVRTLKTPFVSPPERRRLRAVGEVIGREIRVRREGRCVVLRNLPPAVTHHLSYR
jgi:phospholipid N-methyltransferase